jgi:hypothetical protein
MIWDKAAMAANVGAVKDLLAALRVTGWRILALPRHESLCARF